MKHFPKVENRTMYISIPISDVDPEFSRKKAERWEKKFRTKGYDVINPLVLGSQLDWELKQLEETPDWLDYMERDILELGRATDIFFCWGWQDSRGCRIENAIAKAFKLTMYYE